MCVTKAKGDANETLYYGTAVNPNSALLLGQRSSITGREADPPCPLMGWEENVLSCTLVRKLVALLCYSPPWPVTLQKKRVG